MVKLVILIDPPEDWQQFETGWPTFLRLAESMPGLQRETSSRVERMLFGQCGYSQIHELYFDGMAQAEAALASPQGQAAGRILQQITGGQVTLFLADHKEDAMENIRKFTHPDASAE